MSVFTRFLPDNPVLTKELRVRMRGARAYWILFGYLGFVTAVLLINYKSWVDSVQSGAQGGSDVATLGQSIFQIMTICQAFLVLFITPAITSGSLTIEKEQQTLDMLTMTRLSRASVIAGKLLSAVAFTALLLTSSLPLISICFMLGSVDPQMVFSTYMEMLLGSFFIGAIGIAWSSLVRTTTSAVILTYITMLFLVGFLFFERFLFQQIASTGMTGTGGSGGWIVTNFSGVALLLFGDSYLGLQIPKTEGIGFCVLCLTGGILISAIAMTRLEMWPHRRAWLLRGMTTLFIALVILPMNIWWLNLLYNPLAGGVKQPALGALSLTILILILILPTFTTGELQPFQARRFFRYLLWGWSRKGLSQGKLASGLPFMILFSLFCLSLFPLTYVFFGKTADLAHSAELPGGTNAVQTQPVTIITNIAPSGKQIKQPAPPPAPTQAAVMLPPAGDFPQAALAIMCFIVGFGLYCQLLSIAFRNRWVAWLLSFLSLFAIFILPGLGQLLSGGVDNMPLINLHYLNPFQVLEQMMDSSNYWKTHEFVFKHTPMWLVTSTLWIIIGILSFLAALPFVRREAKINKPIPYEELIMES